MVFRVAADAYHVSASYCIKRSPTEPTVYEYNFKYFKRKLSVYFGHSLRVLARYPSHPQDIINTLFRYSRLSLWLNTGVFEEGVQTIVRYARLLGLKQTTTDLQFFTVFMTELMHTMSQLCIASQSQQPRNIILNLSRENCRSILDTP
jgi:hypothetical protein